MRRPRRAFYGAHVLRALLVAGLAVIALAGCTDAVPAVPATTTTTGYSTAVTPPPSSTAATAPTAAPTAQVTPAYSQHRTGSGCPRTSASTPRSALTARIGDIDHDGRDDVEWAFMRSGSGTLHFGVTTASGATIGTSQSFASGAYRRVVIARLRDGTVVALPSDAHGIPLFTFADCAFHRPEGVDGEPYEFGQGDLQGDGIGAGCRDGQLVGLQDPQHGRSRALTATTVRISADGRTATNGATTTLFPDADQHPAADQAAQRPSCGADPVLTFQ